MEHEFVIAGRYVLCEGREHLLGRGGMGEVYRGYDRETEEPVAIKALRADRIARADEAARADVLLERFKREGEILRELAHPNIVQMLAVDEVDDRQFLVMEYVPGGSLRDRLAAEEPMSLVEIVEMALELADALSRVHHLGIVHRDIKPDNILLMEDGTPRLTDFGVAHLSASSRVTGAGAVIGTLDYLSPEACNGRGVDARSDIWSFGVVLYEMLVGRVPFSGNSAAMTAAAISTAPTPPIERGHERVPPELARLVGDMLVKDRKERLGSARKVAAELESILAALRRRPAQTSSIEVERKVSTGTLAGTGDSLEWELGALATPDSRDVSPQRRTELRLLDKVRRHWIVGVLDQSKGTRMRLPARRCDELVELPWDHLEVERARRRPLDLDGSLVELFEGSDRALLLLGEAGSGKSTQLLELTKALLTRAVHDPREPIPVVLSLSSWTNHGGDLAAWIVDELVAKYQLPRRLGRAWLESERLLLLLDDFVADRPRIDSINRFREQHGLVGLVICGRTEGYDVSEGARLRLGAAIELLRPSEEELVRILRSVEPSLIETLEQDPQLRELACSPLMLALLRAVYAAHSTSSDESTRGDSDSSMTGRGLRRDTGDEQPLRDRVFSVYVRRALRRKRAPEEARARLTELAVGMADSNQRVFLIEQLQPSWLRSRALQWVYLALTRAFLAVFICTSLWLVHELLLRFGVPEVLSHAHVEGARLLGLPNALGELLALASIGAVASPALIVLDGLVYERRRTNGNSTHQDFDLGLVGLRLATLFVVFVALFKVVDSWTGAITAVSIVLLLNVFLLVQRGHPSFASEIEPVEALGWSWRQAAKWGALAIPLTLGPALILTWIGYPIRIGTFVLATGVLFVFVCAGLQHRELDVRSRPNLGTVLSARNAARAGTLVAGAQLPLYYLWWHDWHTVGLGMLTAGLVTALSFGLYAVLQHVVLRALLVASGQLPLHLQETLEQAVDCGLMRRVGGGYMFTHALLQDYFAALPRSDSESARGEAGAAST